MAFRIFKPGCQVMAAEVELNLQKITFRHFCSNLLSFEDCSIASNVSKIHKILLVLQKNPLFMLWKLYTEFGGTMVPNDSRPSVVELAVWLYLRERNNAIKRARKKRGYINDLEWSDFADFMVRNSNNCSHEMSTLKSFKNEGKISFQRVPYPGVNTHTRCNYSIPLNKTS